MNRLYANSVISAHPQHVPARMKWGKKSKPTEEGKNEKTKDIVTSLLKQGLCSESRTHAKAEIESCERLKLPWRVTQRSPQ